MKHIPWLAILTAILCTGAAQAENMSLTANDAVAIALKQNPVMQAQRLNKQAQLAGISEEEARFGRTLSLQMSHADSREPSISSLEGVPTTHTNAQQVGLALSQNLTTGGRLDITLSQNRTSNNAGFRTIDPVYDSDIAFRFTQPLLRGRGDVNKIGLQIAQNDLTQAEINVEGYQRDLEANVRSAYWELVLAQRDLEVKQQLYAGGQRVLETVKARVAMGAEARNSILQAELGVARREEAIILAEDRVQDAEDRLKTLMGWTDRMDLHIAPVESPTITPFDDNIQSGIQRALSQNADYRRTAVDVRTHALRADLAKDETRPEVNLSLRAGLSGIGAQYADDLRGLGDADGRSWQGGFSIDIPLGVNTSRERYQQRLLEKEQAELTHSYQRIQLEETVRERFRQVRTDGRRAEVAQLAQQLSERSVKEEEERLALGLSTVREVLDAQDDLAAASASHLQAVVDYQKAIIAWHQITGS